MIAPTSNGHPDLRGRRLLPTLIDDLADRQPDNAWASIPRSADIKEGFQDISFRQLVNLIDGLAWWIESRYGRSSTFETVAYLG